MISNITNRPFVRNTQNNSQHKTNPLKINSQLTSDTVSFKSRMSPADMYNLDLKRDMERRGHDTFIGKAFQNELIAPIEEYLASKGIAIKVQKTTTPPLFATKNEVAGLNLYEAVFVPHENGIESDLKTKALTVPSQMKDSLPQSLSGYTPNFAKKLLLEGLAPYLEDNGVKAKVAEVSETIKNINFAMKQKDPWGIYACDAQYVYAKLIPDTEELQGLSPTP